jgi:hypothetical protein
MPDRRGTRFIAEVAFLVALAAGVTIAELGGLEIAGIMLLGWAIVAVIEWAAWRDTPHYGHGLPPRYYVPRIDLPPPQALEQVAAGYPEAHRDEAPTWIASAELRAELLGEWPVAPAGDADAPGTRDEDTQIEPPPVELPPVPEPTPSTPDASKLSRYSLDPLADDEPEPRRFGRRARSQEAPAIDVPERPPDPRPLPGSLNPPVE